MDIFRNISNFNHTMIIVIVVFVSLFFLFESLRRYKYMTDQFDSDILMKIRNKKTKSNIFKSKKILLFIVIILLALVVLRPQWGAKEGARDAMGIDIVFTLDISDSMKALDFSDGRNQVDRLTAAKNLIKNFLYDRKDDRVSLVVFAGDSFVSCPLTMDHNAFVTFLDDTSYSDVEKGGTNLGEALKASLDRFSSGGENEDKRSKVIFLITDGEDQDSNYEDIIDIANDDGVKIFTIGIGGEDGSLIPDGTDMFGRMQYKTYQGELVRTSLDEDTLIKIADETGGEYFNIADNEDLDRIHKQLEDIEKSKIEVSGVEDKEEQYQYFLLMAFLLFISYVVLPDNI